MRTLSVAALLMAIFLQTGCTLTSRSAVARKEPHASEPTTRYVTANQLEVKGKLEQAREIYQELHDKHPKNKEYLHRLAVVCTRLQRYGEAASLYEQAYAIDARNVSLLIDMGYSSYLKGDDVAAETRLREALHVSPGNVRASTNLALVVGRKGELQESLALLKEVLSEADALCGMGYIHSQRGERELAVQRYQEALELEPSLKQATQALAELSKSRPPVAVAVETTQPKDDSVKLIDVSLAEFEQSAVQQVRAESEAVPEIIVRPAVDFDESTLSIAPKLLQESPDITPLTSVDEPDWTVDETAETASVVKEAKQLVPVDDWASDEPVVVEMKTATSSASRADFESETVDQPVVSQPSTQASDQKKERLTFSPPKSRVVRRVAPREKLEDDEYPLPTITPAQF